IEIITSPNQRPKQDWLQFVVSSRARTKIRHFVRKEQRERSRVIGRQLLEKAFKKASLNLTKLEKSQKLNEIIQEMKYQDLDEVLMNIGLGKLQTETVITRFTEDPAKEEAAKEGPIGKIID